MAENDPGLPFNFLFEGNLDLPSWLLIIIGTVVIGTFHMVNQIIGPWIERKAMARMQGRRGPVYVGWRGFLQIPADLIKLAIKEDTRPAGADRLGFFLAIFLTSVTAILSFAPIPLGVEGLLIGNFSIGVLYIFAVFSLFPPAMMIGGWASNSKYSLIGGFRSAGQLIAYEIPMFLSAVGIIAVVGSFSLLEITQDQIANGWFIFRFFPAGLVLGFIFYVASVAETERIPFDIPEAEAELVMGPRTEFSGWRYALLLMVEYIHMWTNAALVIFLFFGGFDPLPIPRGWFPAIDPFRDILLVQFLAFWIKAYFFIFIATWLRSTLGRLRIDQLLSLGWKQFLPVTMAALVYMLTWDFLTY